MKINKVRLKAAIFLDHANIYRYIQNREELRDYRINYRKLKEILLQGYTSVGTYAFLAVTNPVKPRKKKFIEYLEKEEFMIFTRPLAKKSDGGLVQKGVDTLMSLMIESFIPTFDIAIIVAGDIDYTVIIGILNNMYKGVQVWSWKDSISKDLSEETGEENVFYIDTIWDKIKRKRKRNDP